MSDENQIQALLHAKAQWFDTLVDQGQGARRLHPFVVKIRPDGEALAQVRACLGRLLSHLCHIYGRVHIPAGSLVEQLSWITEAAERLPFLSDNGLVRFRPLFAAQMAELQEQWRKLLISALPGCAVSGMQKMVNVRIAGTLSNHRDAAPWADSQPHAECWVGEPLDSVALYMPAQDGALADYLTLFDTLPEYFPAHFRHASSYTECLEDLSSLGCEFPELDLHMGAGELYVVDSLVVRRINRDAPWVSVGLDGRLRTGVTQKLGASFLGTQALRRNYDAVPPHVFRGIDW